MLAFLREGRQWILLLILIFHLLLKCEMQSEIKSADLAQRMNIN